MCTPVMTAWELHRAWPESDLRIIGDAGHAFDEPGILDALIEATDRFSGASRDDDGADDGRGSDDDDDDDNDDDEGGVDDDDDHDDDDDREYAHDATGKGLHQEGAPE
jgi:proline iminopeptidase